MPLAYANELQIGCMMYQPSQTVVIPRTIDVSWGARLANQFKYYDEMVTEANHQIIEAFRIEQKYWMSIDENERRHL